MGVTCSMPALRLLLNRTAIGIKAPITKAHIVMAINCVTERNTYPPGADDDADSLRRTSGVVPSFRSTHMALSGVGVAGNIQGTIVYCGFVFRVLRIPKIDDTTTSSTLLLCTDT